MFGSSPAGVADVGAAVDWPDVAINLASACVHRRICDNPHAAGTFASSECGTTP